LWEGDGEGVVEDVEGGLNFTGTEVARKGFEKHLERIRQKFREAWAHVREKGTTRLVRAGNSRPCSSMVPIRSPPGPYIVALKLPVMPVKYSGFGIMTEPSTLIGAHLRSNASAEHGGRPSRCVQEC